MHGKMVIFEQKMELSVISEAYNLEAYNSVAMLLFFREQSKFEMRVTYMISCFIGVYLSGLIFLVYWPRRF